MRQDGKPTEVKLQILLCRDPDLTKPNLPWDLHGEFLSREKEYWGGGVEGSVFLQVDKMVPN